MSAHEFHLHLDACAQCRDHPFSLCTEGLQRLMALGGWTADTCRVCGNHIGFGPPAEHLGLCDRPECKLRAVRKGKRRARRYFTGRGR